MDYKSDRNRRLADYIYNDLGPEEMVEFEKELSGDPQLAESYHLNVQVKDYLQAKLQLEEMRSDPMLEDAEKLADMAFNPEVSKDTDQQPIHSGPKKKRIRRIAFSAALAASVTIIIAVGLLPFSVEPARLFEKYYEPIEASDFSQRGEANEQYSEMAKGINFYMAGEYEQSIGKLNELASDPAFRPEVHFFTALSYLGLGQYRQAQGILESVLDGDARYEAESLWYLSLCCVKTGEFGKATALLAQLEQHDGFYKKDAQSLLKKLRRFKQ